MKVKEIIKLIPYGTTLFISTDVFDLGEDPSFIRTCEFTYKVGSRDSIPMAEREIEMIKAMDMKQIHIITENMYV